MKKLLLNFKIFYKSYNVNIIFKNNFVIKNFIQAISLKKNIKLKLVVHKNDLFGLKENFNEVISYYGLCKTTMEK